jgi:hypothetical protein
MQGRHLRRHLPSGGHHAEKKHDVRLNGSQGRGAKPGFASANGLDVCVSVCDVSLAP